MDTETAAPHAAAPGPNVYVWEPPAVPLNWKVAAYVATLLGLVITCLWINTNDYLTAQWVKDTQVYLLVFSIWPAFFATLHSVIKSAVRGARY